MQRGRRKVKRQRNEAPRTEVCYDFGVPMSAIEASLEFQEGPFALGHSPNNSHLDRQSVCNSWTAGELDVAGKLVPLCRGCQVKCHNACAKVGNGSGHPSDTVAATSTALLALDRAWEDYLNKLRLDNGMLIRR
ncbi:hypothetical protein COCSUDRAFT_57688 [Coccomyxa subellipsoidea C-169]|uniref:Uncharacterized protein n=1 Tax=Coccomyxa subellipsoidea (strain C-169) TaxID=574566 RepID=I0YQ73_COCSC|nr:hypothetical protein COCSUDRAFT_57688 [Coccomyxa subellipsoidea C-169]EIE20542.1 hypothetical protein COCSUDRAFT_57688 [Coccomyxa subellipsoidea C-169]|eukprot:XP_005645086.1 hypothetical protein COCSUDRAFT_57688 [Coccomyxa subellipsoidea C-169]